MTHQWSFLGRGTLDGAPCLNDGCACRVRTRIKTYGRGVTEFSVDHGATWGDLKNGFSGKQPKCSGKRKEL